MIELGFAILSHSNPRQLSRMTKRLSELFDEPPIVCHHDFSKCRLDRDLFTKNVQFVEPFIVTKWSKSSVVRAGLAAIRLLYSRKQPPDWFYLLSGSDYPVRSPESIIDDLANSRFDVFIDNRRIDYELAKNVVPGKGVGFNRSDYIRLAYKRYCALRIPIPSPRHPWKGPAAGHIDFMNPDLLGPLRFFSGSFECFAGEHWFTANGKAAEWLFSARPEHAGLLRHYKPGRAKCAVIGDSKR